MPRVTQRVSVNSQSRHKTGQRHKKDHLLTFPCLGAFKAPLLWATPPPSRPRHPSPQLSTPCHLQTPGPKVPPPPCNPQPHLSPNFETSLQRQKIQSQTNTTSTSIRSSHGVPQTRTPLPAPPRFIHAHTPGWSIIDFSLHRLSVFNRSHQRLHLPLFVSQMLLPSLFRSLFR